MAGQTSIDQPGRPVRDRIRIRLVPETQLRKMAALQHMSLRQKNRSVADCREERADSRTKQRWTVNYVRHMLTNYDRLLLCVPDEGKAGLKVMVLDEIAETYPFLKEECERQKNPSWKGRDSDGC